MRFAPIPRRRLRLLKTSYCAKSTAVDCVTPLWIVISSTKGANCMSAAIIPIAADSRSRAANLRFAVTMVLSSSAINVRRTCSLKLVGSASILAVVMSPVRTLASSCVTVKRRRLKWIRYRCLSCSAKQWTIIIFCAMARRDYSSLRVNSRETVRQEHHLWRSFYPMRLR